MQNLTRSLLDMGLEGSLVGVECRLSNNLPTIIIIGSANKTVTEARDRLRGAFASSKLRLPRKRITINLAPAGITKNDTGLDVAMAVSILQADGHIPGLPPDWAAVGELGLNGSIRPVRGIIGKLLSGRKLGLHGYVIPTANLAQARMVPDVQLLAVDSLEQLYGHLSGLAPLQTIHTGSGGLLADKDVTSTHRTADPLATIAGQEQAKRALIIAAAGGHNLLLSGPPGTGKSMLAKMLHNLLPPPSRNEVLEITHIASLASNNYNQLITNRPFRQPHHSASYRAIIGGGASNRPGEVSLSHRGVLLLDELPEFSRQTLEALRQPLEDRAITLARRKDSTTLPANFILIATANPCPCGYFGSQTHACSCSQAALNRYSNRLSGPIMDRLDLVCTMQPVPHTQLLTQKTSASQPPALQPAQAVARARDIQAERHDSGLLNAHLSNASLLRHTRLTPKARQFMDDAAQKLGLSARAYLRSVAVARTIADLAESPQIEASHIGEALAYRQRSSKRFS